MLSALLWWTIALTKLQTNEYSKDVKIEELKKSLALNSINFSASKLEKISLQKTTLLIDNQKYNIDTNLLNRSIFEKK